MRYLDIKRVNDDSLAITRIVKSTSNEYRTGDSNVNLLRVTSKIKLRTKQRKASEVNDEHYFTDVIRKKEIIFTEII